MAPPRRPAVPFALAALSGAVLGPSLPWLAAVLAAGGPIAAALLVAAAARRRRPGAGRAWRAVAPAPLLGLALAGAAGAAGLWAAAVAHDRGALDPSRPPAADFIEVEGTVVEVRPAAWAGAIHIIIEAGDALLLAEAPGGAVHGDPRRGDRVAVRGRPAPAGRDADDPAARALAGRGIAWRLAAGDVRLIEPGRGAAALLGACARHAARQVDRVAAPERAPLLRALLVGDRSGLDPAAGDAFRGTGTAHVLSISGLHVTLLGGAVLALARALGIGRAARAALAIGAVLLYTGVAGPAVPTLRAAAAGVVAWSLPGRGDAWNRLAVALVVALAWDPLCAREVGTVLSFGTVAGLLALGPGLARTLAPAPRPAALLLGVTRAASLLRATGRSVAGGLAASLASTPLLWATMGELPLVGIFVNPPVVLLSGAALALAAAATALAAVWEPLGTLPMALADLAAAGVLRLVEVAAEVPGGRLVVEAPPAVLAVLAAGLVALGAVRAEGRPRLPPSALALLASGGLLLLAAATPRPGGAPEVRLLVRRSAALVAGGGGEALLVGRRLGARDRAEAARALGVAAVADGDPARGPRRIPLGPGLVRIEAAGRRLIVATCGGARAPPLLVADDALRAEGLVILGRAAPEAVRRLAARVGPAWVVAPGAPPAAVAPARLVEPDRRGLVRAASLDVASPIHEATGGRYPAPPAPGTAPGAGGL